MKRINLTNAQQITKFETERKKKTKKKPDK